MPPRQPIDIRSKLVYCKQLTNCAIDNRHSPDERERAFLPTAHRTTSDWARWMDHLAV